jgi:PAS domain S-box-containing protein
MLELYQEYSSHIEEIFENSFDYIYLHDKNGNIIDVNNVILRNLGYSKEEILKMKVTDFLVEEVVPDVITEINDTIKTGIVNRPKTYKVRKKNGDFVFIEASAIPLNKNGEFYAILGIGHDVTVYKRVEQHLKVSEKKYKHLFNQSPFSIILFDSEGNLIESNGVLAQRLSLYTEKDLQGKNFIEIATHFKNSKQLIQLFSERIKLLQQGEDLSSIEFYLTKMNGENIWLHWQSSRFEIDNQSYIQVIIHDITERKKAEEQLKESEEKYRFLSENTDDLIVVYNDDLTVFYSNEETHARILGYSSDELQDLSFRISLIHNDDLNQTGVLFREGFKKGNFKQQIRIKHKDGHILWFETKGRTFRDKNGVVKMLAVSRDITEMKSTEERLKESEKGFQVLFDNSTSGIAYHKIMIKMKLLLII